MLNKAPRGTVDIFGEEMSIWHDVEQIIRDISKNHNIEEIRTPIFEYTELFVRGVGESSDIVNKEIYTFLDKKGRSLSLKPEGTACIVRSFIENKMYADTLPKKFFYLSPFFRYEKPQAGRQRQFHQLGVEYFGTDSVYADAEVISVANDLISKFGLKNVRLEINSLGDTECRKNFNESLKRFLAENIDSLCQDCKERYLKNPMRVFDCKNSNCQSILVDAPIITDSLGEQCKSEFEKLKAILTKIGVEYAVNKKLVRGLDYYTKTVFEFICDDIGANSSICGGGRYNNLVEEMSGISVPAVGFGMGMERLILTIKANKDKMLLNKNKTVYIGSMSDDAKIEAIKLASVLRNKNIICENDIVEKNVKQQMKYANKKGIDYVIIIGDSEIETKCIKLKNMETGQQIELNIDDYDEIVQNILR